MKKVFLIPVFLLNICLSCEENTSEIDPSIPFYQNLAVDYNVTQTYTHIGANFNKYNNLDNFNDMTLDVHGTKDEFFARENELGTVIYNNEYFNYLEFAKSLNEDKIKFYLIMNLDLNPNDLEEILNGKSFGNDGFLNKKTVYKMSEYNDR